VKTPDWLKTAVAEHAANVLAGTEQRAGANAAVAAAITGHPEFLAERAAALADQQVARWLKEHESSGDLFQAALFPLLPASMRTTPKKSAAVASMTGRDLDNAKAMLWNRTQNAKDGADRERATFSAFYDRVRPLLKDDRTVGEVLAVLASGNAA
jgi:hypothetical protein